MELNISDIIARINDPAFAAEVNAEIETLTESLSRDLPEEQLRDLILASKVSGIISGYSLGKMMG